MKLVDGHAEIENVGQFLETTNQISEQTGSTIQFFDADYVAGEQHLRRAAELARRAAERGTTIAREQAVELLVYAAGRRQINRALEMGVSEGSMAVVGVVDGGDEPAAVDALEELLASTDSVEWGNKTTLTQFFDISDAEIAVVEGGIEAIVLERVALLAVET